MFFFLCHLLHRLKVQLVKKYPLISPSIEFDNVKGLNKKKQKEIIKQLKQKCRSLTGFPMVCELVQCVEAFLVANNSDPTVSAWDQMNAREEMDKKVAQEDERKLLEEAHHHHSRTTGEHNSHSMNDIEKENINREFERQIEALKADEDRRQSKMNLDFDYSSENDASFDDDDDFDFDDAFNNNDASSSSRYKNDFIELDFLGKGGGGEVVKVRNRLDRRIYAIKKVVMQSEQGQFEKVAKLENAKLLREVTTISRMTHKNIVRYYQAWVEGDDKQKNDDRGDKIISSAVSSSEESSNSSEESEYSTSSRKGFFKHSFHGVDSDDSSATWSDEDELATASNQPEGCDDVFLNNNFSPLLAGIGNMVPDVMKHYEQPSSHETSNIFGESESEMDTSKMKRKYEGSIVLHIQMEYCSTTLRHLIDDGYVQKMKTDEVWTLIRQILEALDYIHKV